MKLEGTHFSNASKSVIYHLLILSVLSFFIFGCTNEKLSPQDLIEAHFKTIYPKGKAAINNISTLANCTGPDGSYITITESDGGSNYLFFHQNFFSKDDFRAVTVDAKNAFSLDDSLQIADTLSEISIAIIKSHEFHKIALVLDDWFKDLTTASDTTYFSTECRQLLAEDQWGLPYRLFFDKDSEKFIGYQLDNPASPEEKVQIFYKDWSLQDGILLFDKIDILQGADQKYTFDFDRIQINNDQFNALKF